MSQSSIDDICVVRVSGWMGDLGSMKGDRGREERRKQEWILAEGLNTGTSVNFELKQEATDLDCNRSNVGGFHSTDDLWSWSGMKKCALPALIDATVLQVE